MSCSVHFIVKLFFIIIFTENYAHSRFVSMILYYALFLLLIPLNIFYTSIFLCVNAWKIDNLIRLFFKKIFCIKKNFLLNQFCHCWIICSTDIEENCQCCSKVFPCCCYQSSAGGTEMKGKKKSS